MMKKNNRRVVLAVVLILVVCAATIGGTIAWLKAETTPVVNEFTTSDITIDLKESENLNFKMVPGNDITKDPVVTVEGGSEACWLFVKIEKANQFEKYMTYGIAAGWTEVPGTTDVYYREVGASADDQVFHVLANDKVTVNTDVTKADMTAANAAKPTLTFTAYAIQKDNIADVNAAAIALGLKTGA